MHNHIAVIQHEPALLGLPFDPPSFLMFLPSGFQHTFGERVEHPVAGTVADDEIICKRRDVFDVKNQDVFALSVLQGVNDFMGKFECVQISPLFIFTTETQSLTGCFAKSIEKTFLNTLSCSMFHWLIFFNRAEYNRV